MVDIQSLTAEIRRGNKKEEERKKERNRMKIYMVCPITYSDHKKLRQRKKSYCKLGIRQDHPRRRI